jgi:hypothetical protein
MMISWLTKILWMAILWMAKQRSERRATNITALPEATHTATTAINMDIITVSPKIRARDGFRDCESGNRFFLPKRYLSEIADNYPAKPSIIASAGTILV